jgi:hypothetical protein
MKIDWKKFVEDAIERSKARFGPALATRRTPIPEELSTILGVIARMPKHADLSRMAGHGFEIGGDYYVPTKGATHYSSLMEYAQTVEEKRAILRLAQQYDDPMQGLTAAGVNRIAVFRGRNQFGIPYRQLNIESGAPLSPESRLRLRTDAKAERMQVNYDSMAGTKAHESQIGATWEAIEHMPAMIGGTLGLEKMAKDRNIAQNAAIDAAMVAPFFVPYLGQALMAAPFAIPSEKRDILTQYPHTKPTIGTNIASDVISQAGNTMRGVAEAVRYIASAPPQSRAEIMAYLQRVAPKVWVNQVKQMFHDNPVGTTFAAIPIWPGITPVSIRRNPNAPPERIPSPTQFWMRKALETQEDDFAFQAARSVRTERPHSIRLGHASTIGDELSYNPAVKEHFEAIKNVPVRPSNVHDDAVAYTNLVYYDAKGEINKWERNPRARIEMGRALANSRDIPLESDVLVEAPRDLGIEAQSANQTLDRLPKTFLEALLHEVTHIDQGNKGHRLTAGPVNAFYKQIYPTVAAEAGVPAGVTYRLMPSEWKADEAARNVGHYIVYPRDVLQMTPREFHQYVQRKFREGAIRFANKKKPEMKNRKPLRGAGLK